MAAPEATIAAYGLENPAQAISYTIVEAYALPGYIVKVGTTKDQMTGCSAATNVPDGYIIKSTVPATMQAIVNLEEGSAQTLQFVGVQALIPGQVAYLQLAACTTAVTAIGDMLQASTIQGCITPRNAASVAITLAAGVVFCKALETKGALAYNTPIKVRIVNPVYCPATVVL
jgi:hypothetical protein